MEALNNPHVLWTPILQPQIFFYVDAEFRCFE